MLSMNLTHCEFFFFFSLNNYEAAYHFIPQYCVVSSFIACLVPVGVRQISPLSLEQLLGRASQPLVINNLNQEVVMENQPPWLRCLMMTSGNYFQRIKYTFFFLFKFHWLFGSDDFLYFSQ